MNNNIKDIEKNQFIDDFNKNEKFYEKKTNSVNLSSSYARLKKFKKSDRIKYCGTFLEFNEYSDNTLKLKTANFCKVRLCPMCSWRRSLKTFGQVSKVMDYLDEHTEYEYLFLTLTVKNVSGTDLDNTLKHMSKSFSKLIKRKDFKNAYKGFFRSLEVTFNKKNNEYHPHYHLILAVDKSYFNDSRKYLSQDKLTQLWKQSLQVEYTPIIDIRRIKKDSNSVAEVSKYTVKDTDYLIKENDKINESRTDEVVSILDEALHGKRLTSFGYEFKEIHNKLNLDDNENGDLIHTDNDDEIRKDLLGIVRYIWSNGNYVKLYDV